MKRVALSTFIALFLVGIADARGPRFWGGRGVQYARRGGPASSSGEFLPGPCVPRLDATESTDSMLARILGYDNTSCGGSSRRCGHLPRTCFRRGSAYCPKPG